MKKVRIFSFTVCLFTLCMVTSIFAGEVEEQETIQGISSAVEVLSTSMTEDEQTSTATLEGTAWGVEVITIPPTATTTATLIFSDGTLTVTDWIATLGPGAYTEEPKQDGVSFSATIVKKIFGQNITYRIRGLAKLEKKIAGLIQNATWNVFYIFYGTPLEQNEE